MSQIFEGERVAKVLESMFQECGEGRGGVLVMSGPVGTGKTGLLHSFAEQTLQSDALVLTATAAKTEREQHFEVLAQLFHPLAHDPKHRDLVDRLLRSDACTTVNSGLSGEEVDQAQVQVFHMLWMLLTRELAKRPVVMLVDDVQYSDEGSFRGLLFMARRFRLARGMMVLTEQTGPHHQQDPLFHADLFRQPHCRRLRLSPLTEDGVVQMLGQTLAAEEARALAPEYLAATGGNALLVGALLDDHRRAEPDAVSVTRQLYSGAFGDAIIACLHRVGPPAVEVATMAAVLGKTSSPARIAAMLDIGRQTVHNCVDTLNVTGVLSGGRLRHPAAELAVLGQIAPEDRGRLHIKAATVLHEDKASCDEVFRHLLAAGLPLPQWSVEVLRDRAEEALFADRIEEAVQCLELAHTTCPDARIRGAITALLTVLEWRSDPATASRRFPMLGAILREGHLSQRDASTFLRLLLWHGHVAEAEEVLKQFAELPPPDDPVAAAEMRLLWTWLAHSFPPLARRFSPAVSPVRAHQPAVSGGLQSQATDVLTTVLSGDGGEIVSDQAERLLETCQLRDSTLEPLTTVLTTLVHADRMEVAAHWCESLLRQAEARRAPTWQAVLSSSRAEIALRQGDLVLAKQYGRNALEHISLERWGASGGVPLAVLLRAATEMGDLGEAARVVRQPVPETILETRFGLRYLEARGHYFLARGWSHTARNDFQLCGELVTEWGIDLPGLILWRLDLAEAYLRLGQADQARALVEEQLSRVAGRRSRARGIALRLLAATGRPDAGVALLTESADSLSVAGDRLELARTLTDLAHVHVVLGDAEQARAVGGKAADLAIRCHAEPLVQRAALVQERQGGGLLGGGRLVVDDRDRDRDPIAALSESERRVAALAVKGYTNRQIAHQLFITVSTVEQHLTSTYRKLKVNRRAELPSALELVVDSA